MFKHYRFVLLLALVFVIGCSVANAGPSVSLLSFDSSTFTYIYRVIQGPAATSTLTDFNIDAYTKATDPYTMVSPQDNTHFGTSRTTWNNPVTHEAGIEYQFFGGFVKPGTVLTTPWVGDFTLIVPNTHPVPGRAITYGTDHILIAHDVSVPGPVPEPSSCIALGAMLAGMCPAILRLRRR